MTTVGPTSSPGWLVVEGQNDLHLVTHLCRRSDPGLGSAFAFHDAQGVNGVLDRVRAYINQPDVSAVGFVVDADADPVNRWREVADRITAANSDIQLPPSPEPDGTIIPENPAIGSPRIGIWVMPDNSATGELEDFVAQMIPGGDPVWPLSQDYIDGIPPEARKFDDDSITKNQVHAWLAARRFPGLVGLAIREGDLSVNNPLSQCFLTWLSRLFR